MCGRYARIPVISIRRGESKGGGVSRVIGPWLHHHHARGSHRLRVSLQVGRWAGPNQRAPLRVSEIDTIPDSPPVDQECSGRRDTRGRPTSRIADARCSR